MTKSKDKGNTFERKIAKALSERFADKCKITTAFRRATDSGSYFGGLNEHRITTHCKETMTFGDIICPESFRFSVECKHYRDAPGIHSLVAQHIPQWDQWIEQAQRDASKSGKSFLLIIKYNRMPEMAITDSDIGGNTFKGYSICMLSELLERNDEFFWND